VSVSLRFSSRELRDLGVAWIVLGVAFAIFFAGGGSRAVSVLVGSGVVGPLLISLVTAGLAFLLHELAHKVVAVRFGQVAEFRADYGMLFLAVMSALVGFLFAAPGAVHHRGRLTPREHGLIALAGPATNAVLAVVFVPLYLGGVVAGAPLLADVGGRGVAINLFLAAFNLVPVGGLDGRTVLDWSTLVFVMSFVPAAAIAVVVVFVLNIGF
jgi:Zn-dependent protease